jgi:hypothetical protein
MSQRLLPTLSLTLAALVVAGCGPSNKPANTGTSAVPGNKEEPRVIIEESSEVWYDQTAGSDGQPSKTREFYQDITKETGVKGDPTAPVVQKKIRVIVRFPIPKVEPKGAREPHTMNRVIWDARQQIALCFYKGTGKEPTEEMSMVGFVKLGKDGKVLDSGVESSDPKLKAPGNVDECIMENVKGLTFLPAGDESKVRFKLKLQTVDGSSLPDFVESKK